LEIVERDVKPYRQETKENGDYRLRRPLPEKWWQYNCARMELYRTIKPLQRVLVRPEVSNTHAIVSVPTNQIFANVICVFATEDDGILALLQSTIHEVWARHYGSTMRTDLRYTTKDCFETFPFPSVLELAALKTTAKRYDAHRTKTMETCQLGLTPLYNRFHNLDESCDDIQTLRDIHVGMDQSVAAAYGWNELQLDHDFHETKQGVRFTISESARREVLQRLLKLNHERYEEEVAQGLHKKRKGGKKSAPKKKAAQKKVPVTQAPTLFDMGGDEES
jgi:hypothetical protein